MLSGPMNFLTLLFMLTTPRFEELSFEQKVELVDKARKRNGITDDYFNFAVTGPSGTGKSSLINAVCGKRADEKGAASTDVVECTRVVQRCNGAPMLPHVMFFDLMGFMTLANPEEGYFVREGLMTFDYLVVLTNETLGEAEIRFVREALRFKQPVAFVRSRCDEALKRLHDEGKIAEINQDAADDLIRSLHEFHFNYIEKHARDLAGVGFCCVSARVLYEIANQRRHSQPITKPRILFEEDVFLEKMKEAAAEGRTRR